MDLVGMGNIAGLYPGKCKRIPREIAAMMNREISEKKQAYN